MGKDTDLLVAMLEDSYRTSGWHGPSLRSTIARVSEKEATWRPGKGKHNIAEIVVHCAYWKYAGRRRLTGGKRGSFAIKGSNWFKIEGGLTAKEWKEFKNLLDDEHEQLLLVVSTLSGRVLQTVPPKSKVTNLKMIYGLAAHDAYHAGQIRTIRGLGSVKK